MTQTHPITPPPELVQQWEEQFLERPTINGCFIQSYIAAKAAQWGADQELEACCGELPGLANFLRAARRPKPPSLKEQAMETLNFMESEANYDKPMFDTIRRALNELPDN
jgi:hypothetical protein